MLSNGKIVQNRYRIERLLDRSAFGDFYLAYDMAERRAVGLKLIDRALFDDAHRLDATIAELAEVNHPALAPISEHFGDHAGWVYTCWQPQANSLETIRAASPGRRLGVRAAILASLAVLDGLAALHAHTPALLHRDIRPANIFVAADGQVTLTNYGVFHPRVSEPDGFAPPEHGFEEAGPPADLYALGAALYLLLTGSMPPAAHERQAGKTLTPPQERRPDLPPELARIIARLLALRPEERFRTAADAARALAEQLEQPTDDRAAALAAALPKRPRAPKARVPRTAGPGQAPTAGRVGAILALVLLVSIVGATIIAWVGTGGVVTADTSLPGAASAIAAGTQTASSRVATSQASAASATAAAVAAGRTATAATAAAAQTAAVQQQATVGTSVAATQTALPSPTALPTPTPAGLVTPFEGDVAQARADADAARGRYAELLFETFDAGLSTRGRWQEDNNAVLHDSLYQLYARQPDTVYSVYWQPGGSPEPLGPRYMIEADTAFGAGDGLRGVGIAFDGQSETDKLVFLIRSDNTWQVLAYQNSTRLAEYSSAPIPTDAIDGGRPNNLRVWRRPDRVSFWINNTPVGVLAASPYEGGGFGGAAAYAGPGAQGGAEPIIDNLRVLAQR